MYKKLLGIKIEESESICMESIDATRLMRWYDVKFGSRVSEKVSMHAKRCIYYSAWQTEPLFSRWGGRCLQAAHCLRSSTTSSCATGHTYNHTIYIHTWAWLYTPYIYAYTKLSCKFVECQRCTLEIRKVDRNLIWK